MRIAMMLPAVKPGRITCRNRATEPEINSFSSIEKDGARGSYGTCMRSLEYVKKVKKPKEKLL